MTCDAINVSPPARKSLHDSLSFRPMMIAAMIGRTIMPIKLMTYMVSSIGFLLRLLLWHGTMTPCLSRKRPFGDDGYLAASFRSVNVGHFPAFVAPLV